MLSIRKLFGKSNPRILGQHPNVRSVQFSRDGRSLLSIGTGIKFWDLTTGSATRTIPELGDHQTVSSDWTVVAASRGKRVQQHFFGNVVLGDLATGAEIETLPSPFGGLPDEINDLAFAPDGSVLAMKTFLFDVSVWHIAEKKWATGHLNAHQLVGGSLQFSPDSQYLSFGNLLWDVGIWRQRDLRGSTPREVSARIVEFAPDSQSFAALREDGTIAIIDAATGRELQTLTGHGREGLISPNDLKYSPNGKQLASVCNGQREIKMWDISTGRETRMLTFEDRFWIPIGNWLHSCAFSPDGATLAFASSYQTQTPRPDAPPPVIGLWQIGGA